MTNYTDYDFYKDTYMGNMPESDFDKMVMQKYVKTSLIEI